MNTSNITIEDLAKILTNNTEVLSSIEKRLANLEFAQEELKTSTNNNMSILKSSINMLGALKNNNISTGIDSLMGVSSLRDDSTKANSTFRFI